MAKKQSPKPQRKAGKQQKGRQPAEAPDVQVQAVTEPPVRPDTAGASEPPPHVLVRPAPEAAAAEPAAAEIAPEPTPPVDAEPEPAMPAQAKTQKAAKVPK